MATSLVPSTDAVINEICREPEGSIMRSVYPMALSLDNLKTFWNKTNKFRTLFSEDVNGDFKKFVEMFVSMDGDNISAHGLFWVIDDFVGVYYITHIMPKEAQVHYTFFDRRHTGREQLTKTMMRYVFKRYGFHRLNVEIPLYASKHTFAFVEHIGFVKEGRKREAIQYKDTWFDVACYGLISSEAPNGNEI